MGDVIPLLSRKMHLQGEAKCLGCGVLWRAVVPAGTNQPFECLQCGATKAIFTKFVQLDAKLWCCIACEGIYFNIALIDDVPTVACIGCGELRNAIDLFNK